MDYELLYKLWVKDLDITKEFPYKLDNCIRYLIEAKPFESFVICTFDSSPPEWIDLKIEPA